MPFAGTDKIDPQISPLVQKQVAGGFLDGDIFIRSVGAWEVQLNNAAPVQIPSASANVGDDLLVIVQSSGTYTGPAGWTQHFSGMFGQARVYRRVADGTASDNFTMPATTLFWQAMMVCIGNKRTPLGTRNLSQFQGGFLNQNTSVNTVAFSFPPPLGAQPTSLSLNTSNDPWACVIAWMFIADRQQPATVSPSFTYPNAEGMELIGQTANFRATGGFSVDTMWTGWWFQYVNPSIAYASAICPHIPANNVNQYAQHTRWQVS